MLKTGIGILHVRTRSNLATFIRNSQLPSTYLNLFQPLIYTAVSLNSIHTPSGHRVNGAAVRRPQWKRSIIDKLDVPSGESKGLSSPPSDPKVPKLLERFAPDESSGSDPFSPLSLREDELQSKDDEDDEDGSTDFFDESLTYHSSKIPPIPHVEFKTTDEDSLDERSRLLRKIRDNTSLEDSWEAYTSLLHLQKSYGNSPPVTPFIPLHYLQLLSSELAKVQAAGRRHFFRFLSVLTSVRTSGGTIFSWQWSYLVHCSGKCYRKTTVEDYRIAIGILKDMLQSASVAEKDLREKTNDMLPEELEKSIARPDIVIYNTLLAIASRTENPNAVQHAISMIDAAGLSWVPQTHTAMIPYYMSTNQLDAFPRIAAACLPNELNISVVTQILWAYAYKGRMRIAMQIYDFLRGNIPPEDKLIVDEPQQGSFGLEWRKTFNSDDAAGNPILSLPGFIDHATMPPNGITYCVLIQALNYHGDLIGALTIFRDMLSTIRTSDRPGHIREFYRPRPSIYRSFFLGFARHAGGVRTSLSQSLMLRNLEMDQMPLPEFAARLIATPRGLKNMAPPESFRIDSPWTLENLEIIFENFLEMDWDVSSAEEERAPTVKLSDRTIYWIMVSFAKTTNNDWHKMYAVWNRLDKHMNFSQQPLSRRLRNMRDYLLGRYEHGYEKSRKRIRKFRPNT